MFKQATEIGFHASFVVGLMLLGPWGCSRSSTSTDAQSPTSRDDCAQEPPSLLPERGILTVEEVEEAMVQKELLKASLGDLVDPAAGLKEYGEDGWDYGLMTEADLNQDGYAERVWLIAHANVTDEEPAWDDGQEWQVYVQEHDGRTTHLFARLVQLGKLEMSITHGSPPTVLIQSDRHSESSMYEFIYKEPGVVEARTLASREIMRRPTREEAKTAAKNAEEGGNKRAASAQTSSRSAAPE